MRLADAGTGSSWVVTTAAGVSPAPPMPDWAGTITYNYYDGGSDVINIGTNPPAGGATGPASGKYVKSVDLSAWYINPAGSPPPWCVLTLKGCDSEHDETDENYGGASMNLKNVPPCDPDDGDLFLAADPCGVMDGPFPPCTPDDEEGKGNGDDDRNFGTGKGKVGSVNLAFNIGRPRCLEKGVPRTGSRYRGRLVPSVDFILAKAKDISPEKFKAASIVHMPQFGIWEFKDNLNVIRQLHSTNGLTDIIDEPMGNGYDVRFFRPGTYSALPGENGRFTITGQPFSVWQVRALVNDPETTKPLKLTQMAGVTELRSNIFTQDSADNWTMVKSEANKLVSGWKVTTGGGLTTYTQTVESTLHPGVILRSTVMRYENGRLLERRVGLPPEEIVTRYQYENDRLALKVTEMNGGVANWERRVRGAVEGEPVIYRPFGDEVPPWLNGYYDTTIAWYEQHARKITTTALTPVGTSLRTQTVESVPIGDVQTEISRKVVTHSRGASFITGMEGPLTIEDVRRFESQGEATPSASSHEERFAHDAPPFLVGRPYFTIDENGKARQVYYTMDTPSGATSPVGFTETVINGEAVNGQLDARANVSTKVQRYCNAAGKIVWEREYVCSFGGSAPTFSTTPISDTTHYYNAENHRTQSIRNARTIYSATWSGQRLISETDETGIITTYSNFDVRDNPWRSTRSGVALANGLPAIPQIVINSVYDELYRKTSKTSKTSKTIAGGGLTTNLT